MTSVVLALIGLNIPFPLLLVIVYYVYNVQKWWKILRLGEKEVRMIGVYVLGDLRYF